VNLSSSARDIVTVDLCGGCNFVKALGNSANMSLTLFPGAIGSTVHLKFWNNKEKFSRLVHVQFCYNFWLPREVRNIGQSERTVQMKTGTQLVNEPTP